MSAWAVLPVSALWTMTTAVAEVTVIADAAPPVALEQAAARLGQADGMVAVLRHARRLDEPLFTQMAEVAGARIGGPAVLVTKVTTGD